MYIEDINESYSHIYFDEPEEIALKLKLKLMDNLSVFVDGYKYSPKFRAGVWDGKKHFYTLTLEGMQIPKGLVETVLTTFHKFITKPYTPKTQVPKVEMSELEEFVKTLNLPFEPRPYQIEAVHKCLNNPRKIAVMATGSGKSLTIYILMRWFMSKGMKGVLIVPNINLVEQMKGDFKDYNMDTFDEDAHIIYGGFPKHFDKPITISTWQSTYNKPHLFKEIDYIIIDEAHLAKGESLTAILNASENCVYKFGFTGTLPSNHVERYTLTAVLGKSEKIITPKQLIDLGYATPVQVIMFYLNYSDADKEEYLKLMRKSKTGKYQREISFVESHYKRNLVLSKIALKFSQKGNTLLLYKTLKHGEMLTKFIVKEKLKLNADLDDIVYVSKKITKRNVNRYDGKFILVDSEDKIEVPRTDKMIVLEELDVFFVRGDVDGVKRAGISKAIENKKNAILVATVATVATGVNIKNLHNIILTGSTKSTITLNQSIGRGMRQHKTKDVMRFIDIVDDLSIKSRNGRVSKNYILKHEETRMADYLEHEYPIEEIEIQI